MFKKWFQNLIIGMICLVIISLIISIWLPILHSLRIVFGAIYLLFLPGFSWSWIFWKKGEIDVIERITLSIVLSIALVPLLVFLLNKLGIMINSINLIWEIATSIMIAIIVLIVNNKYIREKIIKKVK